MQLNALATAAAPRLFADPYRFGQPVAVAAPADTVTLSSDRHVVPHLPFVPTGDADGSLRCPAGEDPAGLRKSLEAAGVNVIALRHGQTEANAESERIGCAILCGQVESPLTSMGQSQAAFAAQSLYEALGGDTWLAQAVTDPKKFPVIFSSPLSRAHDTAQALVSHVTDRAKTLTRDGRLPSGAPEAVRQALNIQNDPRITELSFGKYELQRRDTLGHDLPAFAENWDSYQGKGVDYLDAFPGGESRAQVLGRVDAFLEELPTRCPGRTVLMVCHAETIVAAETALGWTLMQDGVLHVAGKGIHNATPYALTDGLPAGVARPSAT